MAPSEPRFFTEDWIITLPSHPNAKFIRMIPSRHEQQIKILSNPLNHPFENPADQAEVWDEAFIAGVNQRFDERYTLSKTAFQAIDILVELDGEIVGSGTVMEIPQVQKGLANIGLTLSPVARGKGLGKAAMQVLLRLSNECQVDHVHAGTMKANVPMRSLAKSLGFVEREEVLEVPGRGVVAEILFEDFRQERWKDLEMNVEFLGPVPE